MANQTITFQINAGEMDESAEALVRDFEAGEFTFADLIGSLVGYDATIVMTVQDDDGEPATLTLTPEQMDKRIH